jgi:hypothetical protein
VPFLVVWHGVPVEIFAVAGEFIDELETSVYLAILSEAAWVRFMESLL